MDRIIKKIRKIDRIHYLPIILCFILLALTLLKISGTSVGKYRTFLYGSTAKDPDLLYGKPRGVRSDEWLSGTPFVVMQSVDNFPAFNQKLGSGRDISMGSETPIKDWTLIFKPYNWSYFVMPLENAFAFKWWFIMFSLIISCYYFCIRILGRNNLLACVFISIAVGLSPFALWWYQTAIYMTLAFGFIMILLSLSLINNEKIKYVQNTSLTKLVYVVSLSYVLTCFALILYPPFLVPTALCIAAFIAGNLLKKWGFTKKGFRQITQPLILMLLSLIITSFIGAIFIKQHTALIKTVSNTIYPGKRITRSGDLDPLYLLDGFVMPLLQRDYRAAHFATNQSEASNFILLFPFLLIPGVVLELYEYFKSKKIDYILLLLNMLGFLLLARALIPLNLLFYKLLLLDRVPNNRLLIGFGFLGIVQMVYLLKKISDLKIPTRKLVTYSGIYSLIVFLCLLAYGLSIIHKYPLFLHEIWLVTVLALSFAFVVFSFLINKKWLAGIALLAFTILSSFQIIPLYRGLGFLLNNKITDSIKQVSSPNDYWGVVNNIYLEQLPLVAGRASVTGVQVYPDLKYWDQIDAGKYIDVYNRQAHAIFSTRLKPNEDMRLVQNNRFSIRLACSPFVTTRVNYLLSVSKLNDSCFSLVKTIVYPKIRLYIYKVE